MKYLNAFAAIFVGLVFVVLIIFAFISEQIINGIKKILRIKSGDKD